METKVFWKSRTFWVGALAALVLVVESLSMWAQGDGKGLIVDALGESAFKIVMLVLTALLVIFRSMSTGPLTLRTPMLFLLLTLVAGMGLGGCSQGKAFSRAAQPVAEVLHDRHVELVAEVPGPGDAEDLRQADEWLAAIIVGDRSSAARLWFGNDNVREDHIEVLHESPRFQQPGGPEVRTILLHDIDFLDYVMAIGEPQGSNN